MLIQVILSWLRHRKLLVPPSVPMEAVVMLADYFCLFGLQEAINNVSEGICALPQSTESRLVIEKFVKGSEENRKKLWAHINCGSDPIIDFRQFLASSHVNRNVVNVTTNPSVSFSWGDTAANGLSLELHPSEDLAWLPCTSSTIPPTALAFTTTQNGKLCYLGYKETRAGHDGNDYSSDDLIISHGFVFEGLGLLFSATKEVHDSFYVLAALSLASA